MSHAIITTITITVVDKSDRPIPSRIMDGKAIGNALQHTAHLHVGSRYDVECSVNIDGPWSLDLTLDKDL